MLKQCLCTAFLCFESWEKRGERSVNEQKESEYKAAEREERLMGCLF